MDTLASNYLELMIHQFYDGTISLMGYTDLNDDEFETIYAVGYNFFTYGDYESAKGVFDRLTTLAPYTAHYWRALGAVNQQMDNFEEAVACYDMAVAMDEADVVSYVYQGESQIMQGNIKDAVASLELAIKNCSQYPEYAPWIARAELLLSVHRQT